MRGGLLKRHMQTLDESEGLQDVTTRLSDRLGIGARPSSACYTAGCCTCKSPTVGTAGLCGLVATVMKHIGKHGGRLQGVGASCSV